MAKRMLNRLLHPAQSPSMVALIYVCLGALWIYLSSYALPSVIPNSEFLPQFELVKGLGFVVATGSVLYLLLKTRPAPGYTSFEAAPSDVLKVQRKRSRWLLVIFMALVLLVPLFGYLVLLSEQPKLRENAFNNLRAIAQLKAEQIENWVDERHSDAQTLARDPEFVRQIARVADGDRAARARLSGRMDAFRSAYGYGAVTVLNRGGDVVLQSGILGEPAMIGESAEDRRLSFFRDKTGELHLHITVPIRADAQTPGFGGALIFHMDPNRFLFPYIRRWPTSVKTGETLLVRRDGESVRFLVEPRYTDVGALNLTRSIDDENLPAARALQAGAAGTYDGQDYRGVPVLAASYPIASTGWQIVTKVDRAEVMKPLYTLILWLGVASLFAIVVVSVSLLILWRQQRYGYELAVQAEKTRADRLLRNFYDLPFIGMAIISPDGREPLRFNAHFNELLGYSSDEMARLKWSDVIHPDDQSRVGEKLAAINSGVSDGFVMEVRSTHRDGHLLDTLVDVKGVRDETGRTDYLMMTVQDVTQQRAAVRALKESEALLTTLVRTIPDLVWVKDVAGHYLLCNPSFEAFFGAREAEIVGRTDYDFVDRALADSFRENDERAMAKGGSRSNEEWLTFRSDGYHGLFETIKTPMCDEHGKLIGVMGIARDITARKKAEERLELVIKGANDAPWDWDLVANEFYYSPQFWRMFGYEIDELPADADLWRRLMHPDDVIVVDQALERITDGQVDRDEVECRFRHKDGHYVPTLVRGVASHDEVGKPVRLTGTVMDLTERKRLEAERHESLRRLQNIASRLPGMVYQYQVFPDGSQRIPYASEAIEELYGLSADEVRDDPDRLFALVHSEDLPRVEDSIAVAARGLEPWKMEFRVKRDSGAIRWLYANAMPERQPDGTMVWYGFVTDVTEKKANEAKVRLAARVFEQAREGIMVTDADLKMVMVNDAFTTITGYSKEEALGNTPGLLSSNRNRPGLYEEMWASIRESAYWQGEIWNRHKDGTIYPEWLSITTLLEPDGQVSGYMGVFEDITARKDYEAHITWLAHHDPLTRLPNRALLTERCEQTLRIARRAGTPVTLLYCDLNRFKYVNDALGHLIGDKLLRAVAERLGETVREEDTVARIGGDEFVLLLPDTGAAGAETVAKKVLGAVNSKYRIDDFEMTASFSIGIAVFPEDGDDFEGLLQRSDIAMYRCKEMGGDNYCFFTPELQGATARALKLESDIQNVVERGELELYFQPQVEVATRSVTGVEALLRWRHPELGLVSPLEFIGIAERSGRILGIGDWVLRTAIQGMSRWADAGVGPGKVAVNLSVLQLAQPNIAETIGRYLEEAEVDPERLELEVTESMIMHDQEQVIETLQKIHALGVTIAIDDFGTGYSSLAYLKNLPVDYLKIDKAFVQDMEWNEGDAIISRSIITLGHSLGLQIIAEGVETEGQLALLCEHGCDQIQGYLFSKPLPEDELLGRIREGVAWPGRTGEQS